MYNSIYKHLNILKDDEELSRVFPNGAKDFQISQRRDAKNIKEILAKSKIKTFTIEEEEGSRSKPCENHCACCHLLRETERKVFRSEVTGCTYNVRQKITCEAKDVIYLVTCKKHNIQGVGCTTELMKKIYHLVLQKLYGRRT